MTLIKPKEGARIGLDGPLCNVKSTEDLTSTTQGHENYRTEAAQHYEHRREHPFLSHVEERNKAVPQQE